MGILALAVAFFALALVPRALVVPTMVTADEDTWLGMAGNMARAVQTGRYEATYQLGHPGITSLWLDILGLGFQDAAEFAGQVQFRDNTPTRRAVSDDLDFLPALARARLAHAAANAALVAVAALVAWRLLGRPAGLAAGLLLALDPFLVAHGQVARMDALQALLVCIALLCAMARWHSGGRRAYCVLGGVALGLALLSKVSSVVFVPMLGAIAVAGLIRPRAHPGWRRHLRAAQDQSGSARAEWAGDPRVQAGGLRRFGRFVLDLLLWGAVAATTFVALWPAMWMAPEETLRRLVEFAAWNSGTPPLAGNFFLGAILPDPGPLFYPLALAFRLTPLACLGLAAGIVLAVRRRRQLWAAPREPIVLGLVICGSLFLLALEGAPKKFDRYLLPMVPLLLVAAGAGLVVTLSHAGRARWLSTAAVSVAALHQLASLPPVFDYPLAYFNPLLGGAATARHVVLVGWGEGMELVSERLNELPQSEGLVAAAFHEETFDASFEGDALPLERFGEADYVVMPIDAEQRRLGPMALHDYLARSQPEVVVRIAGLDYVRAYRLPDPEFGQTVRLERLRLEGTTIPLGDRLRVELAWRSIAPSEASARLELRLVNEQGQPATPAVATLAAPPSSLGDGQIEGVARIPSPDLRGLYRLAARALDAAGRPLPPTTRPPWTSVADDWLVLDAVVVRYR